MIDTVEFVAQVIGVAILAAFQIAGYILLPIYAILRCRRPVVTSARAGQATPPAAIPDPGTRHLGTDAGCRAPLPTARVVRSRSR